jgi:Transposase DDE domain group 1
MREGESPVGRVPSDREALMAWCEASDVDFLFGLAKNVRLTRAIAAELVEARDESRMTGQAARRFKELTWSTRKSWSRKRRVIGKAEWTKGEANPRFIVTSLAAADGDGRHLLTRRRLGMCGAPTVA